MKSGSIAGIRSEANRQNAEFVIVFAPSGSVKKTRIRPAYGGRDLSPDPRRKEGCSSIR
jgi:hypothetical protein